MERESLSKIVGLRGVLISRYEKLRDYKNNPDAIMKEIDHARLLHSIIVELDKVLAGHVEFK